MLLYRAYAAAIFFPCHPYIESTTVLYDRSLSMINYIASPGEFTRVPFFICSRLYLLGPINSAPCPNPLSYLPWLGGEGGVGVLLLPSWPGFGASPALARSLRTTQVTISSRSARLTDTVWDWAVTGDLDTTSSLAVDGPDAIEKLKNYSTTALFCNQHEAHCAHALTPPINWS